MVSVCGLGPMEGTDPYRAAEIIAGEASELFLPLLIDAGIEQGLVARTLGLSDSSFTPGPRGWRHAGASLATNRSRDHLKRLLDACEDVWKGGGRSVDALTLTVMGPLSLASLVELANGHLILSDRRALAGLWEEIQWGLEEFRHTLAAHFGPGLNLSILVTEPLAAQVFAGTIPGTSQWDLIAPLPLAEAAALCSATVPYPLLFDGGAASAGLPAQVLDAQATPVLSLNALHTAYERNQRATVENAMALIDRGGPVGLRLEVGGTDGEGEGEATVKEVSMRIVRMWEKLGFDPATLADRVQLIEAHPRTRRQPLSRRDCVATDGGFVDVSTAHSLRIAGRVADALARG